MSLVELLLVTTVSSFVIVKILYEKGCYVYAAFAAGPSEVYGNGDE